MALKNFYSNLHQEHYDSYWIGIQKFDPVWKTLKTMVIRYLLIMLIAIIVLGLELALFGEGDDPPIALFPLFFGFFFIFGATGIIVFLIFGHPILQLFRPLRIDIHDAYIVFIYPLRKVTIENRDITALRVQPPTKFGILIQDHLLITTASKRSIKIEKGINSAGWQAFLNHLEIQFPSRIDGIDHLKNNSNH